MSATRVNGVGGGLTMVSGINADWASWDAEVTQQVDDTTNYSDGTWGSSNGSGVSIMQVDFAGFLNYGATGTAPGLAGISGSSGTATLTAATGCTYAGNFVVQSLKISHKKVAGAIPMTGRMRSDGDISETWATGS